MKYLSTLRDTGAVFCKLLARIRGFYPLFALSQLLSLSMDFVYTLMLARAFQSVIDAAISGNGLLLSTLLRYVCAALAVVILWGFGDNCLCNRLQDRLQIRFRREMLRSALAAPLSMPIDLGDFGKRYAADAKAAAQFLLRKISSAILSPLAGGIGGLILLALIHPLLAFTALVIGLLTFLLQKRHVPQADAYATEQSQRESDLSAGMYDMAHNLPVLRMFGAMGMVLERIRRDNAAAMQAGIKLRRATLWQQSCLLLAQFLQTLAMVAVGSALAGQGAISIGEIFACIAYGETVCFMFDGVSSGLAGAQSGRAAGKRVLCALDLPPDILHAHIDASIQPNALVMRCVSLRFGERILLENASLAVRQGEKVALIGPSGSGKTTLAKVLCGLQAVDSGECSLASARFCYVPSSCRLFEGSIAENITGFAPEADGVKLQSVIRLLGLNEWIDSLPEGCETQIEAHGDNLSGGQRQRLALARAMYAENDLYILDEPTAALDAASAQRVIDGLLEGLKDKTILLITHDSEMAARMDVCYKIENGALQEEGV